MQVSVGQSEPRLSTARLGNPRLRLQLTQEQTQPLRLPLPLLYSHVRRDKTRIRCRSKTHWS